MRRGLVSLVRDADWLTNARVRAYARILFLVLVVLLAVGLASGRAHLVTDFRSFWAASRLALGHDPIGAYQPSVHFAAERTIPGFEGVGWAAFFYPPIFLLICLPLALLPFWWSALAWVAATGALLAVSVRRYIPRSQSAWLAALSFPAAWMSAASGQSAVLAAALLALAAQWLDRRPALAGMCFGCLAFKPQLGLVVPVALIAAGRWRIVAAASATVGVLAAASMILFGRSAWIACVDNLALARMAIDMGDESPGKIPSVEGAALLLGATPFAAALLQAMTAFAVCVFLWTLARRRPGAETEGAAICVAAALCSPWVHFYDLAVLAFPIAWLASEALRTRWLPWEKSIILSSYALPAATVLAMWVRLPVAPLVMTTLFAAVWRRGSYKSLDDPATGQGALDPGLSETQISFVSPSR